jgi:ABC-2 family transporter protein/ABC transporter
MRVRDQLVYLGELCGRGAGDAARSVDAWLVRLGLADRAADRLDALSHGNQQRVQLIAALVGEPELLVLDEPFSGLDPIAMGAMSELLSDLAAEGVTVLFSSHQLDLVEDLCQDVVIIDHGRIVLAGELAELRAKVPQRFIDIRYRGPAPDWSGYALYATVFGALGSLGSRAEDAQSVAGPVMVVLPVAYFASFAMIAQPASAAARAISYFPLTAPMAMPGRIAMGATAWWEPVAAAVLTLATTVALVQLAGRVYANAILHGGPRLSLKDAWRSTAAVGPSAAKAGPRAAHAWPRRIRAHPGRRTTMTSTDLTSHRLLITVLTGIGVALGVAIGVMTKDVILGVIAGVGFIAIATQMVKLWSNHPGPPVSHH